MKISLLASLAVVGLLSAPSFATNITPDFANAPSGWTVDRYAPDGFANVGSFAGQSNVLGITIGSSGDLSNRPAAYRSTFYNTQGMDHAISGGAGDALSAMLFVPASWADPANGARRSDIWGELMDASSSVVDYPIIGFINDNTVDSFVGFRVWNDQGSGGWVDLSNAVDYNAWNTLTIRYDGTNFDYYVNGVYATSLVADPSAVGWGPNMIMQAYNFADPSLALQGAPANGYTAYWTSDVPMPPTWTVFSAALLSLLAMAGLRKRRA